MSDDQRLEVDRPKGRDVALRFGGSMTGVGLAAGALRLGGWGEAVPASVSASVLLVGIALLVVGRRARRTYRK